MTTSTPIRDIYFPLTACRCSDCIRTPLESHGIHQIGVYKIPSRLSRRGGKITDARVSYMRGSRDGFAHGHIVGIFPNAQGEDSRIWEI